MFYVYYSRISLTLLTLFSIGYSERAATACFFKYITKSKKQKIISFCCSHKNTKKSKGKQKKK